MRANRILAIASKLFSLALVPKAGETLAWRNAALGNPCKGIARNREEGREQFFSQSELTAISDALARYQGGAADCVRLIMLSGCRPIEAMKAEWSEFDKEPGYWIKPTAHTKQRKVHKLPLNPAAIELIEQLRKKRKGRWVFAGNEPGAHLTVLSRVWEFVRRETGLGEDRASTTCGTPSRRSAPAAVSAFPSSAACWATAIHARHSATRTSPTIRCARQQTRSDA